VACKEIIQASEGRSFFFFLSSFFTAVRQESETEGYKKASQEQQERHKEQCQCFCWHVGLRHEACRASRYVEAEWERGRWQSACPAEGSRCRHMLLPAEGTEQPAATGPTSCPESPGETLSSLLKRQSAKSSL